MGQINMQEIWISLNEEMTLRDFMWSVDENNMENGNRELHIFPGHAKFYEKGIIPENPLPVKVQFVQNGCSYGPDFNYKSVSIFDIKDLFDQNTIENDAPDIGNYSEVRSDAIDDFKNTHEIDDIDDISDEMKKELEDYIEEWVQTAVEYDENVARGAVLDEIVDEEKGIKYYIVWE